MSGRPAGSLPASNEMEVSKMDEQNSIAAITGSQARHAAELSHPWPIVGEETRARIQACLDRGCNTWLAYPDTRCPGHSASLTLRDIRGSKRVELQCEGCGRSLSGAIARTMFSFEWRNFKPWDEQLVARRAAEEQARRQQAAAAFEERQAAADDERERRQIEIAGYHHWCRNSPEWHALSVKVTARARGICEACLDARVQVVHHLSYDLGRLPPAWELKAVCHSCHDRLHADKFGHLDDWCPC